MKQYKYNIAVIILYFSIALFYAIESNVDFPILDEKIFTPTIIYTIISVIYLSITYFYILDIVDYYYIAKKNIKKEKAKKINIVISIIFILLVLYIIFIKHPAKHKHRIS